MGCKFSRTVVNKIINMSGWRLIQAAMFFFFNETFSKLFLIFGEWVLVNVTGHSIPYCCNHRNPQRALCGC